MAELSPKKIYALKRKLSRTGFALTGTLVNIAEARGDELGYTNITKTVFLAFSHAYYSFLSVIETICFITGTFVHEAMHLLLTDLNLYTQTIESVPTYEQEIMGDIYNILEDPCIEYFAPLYASESLINALNFMRATVFKRSPRIDEADDPFIQFTTALIQYGDVGLLKGEFTFPEAEECFVHCLPIMDKAIEERSNKKRSEYAKEIFHISRPLWAKYAEYNKAFEEFMKKLREALKQAGKGAEISSGGGAEGAPLSPPKDGEKPAESEKSRRRKITFKRVSREEYEKAMQEAESAGGFGHSGGDITILIPDEPVETKHDGEKSDASAPIPIPADGSAKTDDELQEDSKTDSSESSSGGEDQSGKNANPPTSSSARLSDSSDDSENLDEAKKSLAEESVVSAEDAERINREMESAAKEIEAEELAERKGAIVPLNIPLSSDGYQQVCKDVFCYNARMSIDFSDEMALREVYQKIVQKHQPLINQLTKQMQRVFKNSADEKQYRATGKINVSRLTSGTKTARVFTKKRVNTRSDIYVAAAIDISGSTAGNSIIKEREAAIILAEIFNKLKIPISIFGFTADVQKAYLSPGRAFPSGRRMVDVYHEHYLTGQNTARDRLRLLGIESVADNFDGYSIRYAASLLKKKNAAHKILFIVSDGAPACYAYAGIDGVMDTKLAIKEASKVATVVGILVGNGHPETHREMYGLNFLHIKDPSQLATGLVRCILKQIKEW